ncbi:MAG: response regulator [Candidatus Omnitrophica bacterium]|nr:response regulator [Candidatus Omnitrophota bacterium]MBU1923510.1 response regulator [Candidatus Omnitrophota bacterium]
MSREKILLVDDEADILEVVGVRIKSWGYELLKAKNGKEAIGIVKAKKTDLVVLDYMLPDMDGIAVLKEIRKINKKIPVIMFTSYPNPTAMYAAENLGISAYVAKLSIPSDDRQALLKTAVDMAIKKISEDNKKA